MKSIYGPHGERLIWNEKWGDKRVLLSPLTYTDARVLDEGEYRPMTNDELRAWMSQSDRRNYVHKNGRRRIKLATEENGDVVYVSPDHPHVKKQVSGDDWSKWRKAAK